MSTFAARRATSLAIGFALCLLLSACAKQKSTMSQDAFDRVKNDMTLKDVEAVLGPGTKEEGGDGSGVAAQFGVEVGGPARSGLPVDTYVWESKGKKVKVHLISGKVTNKQKEGF